MQDDVEIIRPLGLRRIAVDEDLVPEFEGDQGHDLFEIDELARFHFFEEIADVFVAEVSAFVDLFFVEGALDQAIDLRVFEEKLHREEEGVFRSIDHFRWENFFGDFALDPFVFAVADFLVGAEGEAKLDEMVVEKGKADFHAVSHGVFVLTNDRPILQPLVPLKFEHAIEKVTTVVAHGRHPVFGRPVFELFGVEVASGVDAPECFQGDVVLEHGAVAVAAHEFFEAPFPLAAEVGGEIEE